jgi:hypothetical protein
MVYKKAYLVTHQLHGSSIIGFQWMDHGALVGVLGQMDCLEQLFSGAKFHHFKIKKKCAKSFKGLF